MFLHPRPRRRNGPQLYFLLFMTLFRHSHPIWKLNLPRFPSSVIHILCNQCPLKVLIGKCFSLPSDKILIRYFEGKISLLFYWTVIPIQIYIYILYIVFDDSPRVIKFYYRNGNYPRLKCVTWLNFIMTCIIRNDNKLFLIIM